MQEVNVPVSVINSIITSDDSLLQNEEYQKISTVLFTLLESGIISLGQGYCVSISDVIHTLLTQINIPCVLTECQLAIRSKKTNHIDLIGFDFPAKPEEVKTHVIIITQTKIPMIIDASIGYKLSHPNAIIVDSIEDKQDRIIANIETPEYSITYQEKRTFKLPMLHQRSIINRMNTDNMIFNSIRTLKIMVILALLISSVNASRGIYDYYQVYINENNHWGPSAIIDIYNDLSEIKTLLKNNKGM